MMKNKPVLEKLVHVLIEEWGADAVHLAFTRALGTAAHKPKDVERLQLRRRNLETPSRLNAAQQVERASIPGEKRELILSIAERFDRKQFLPSVADAREFLIMAGARPPGLKDRTQAWRELFQVLIKLPEDRLETLRGASAISGPAEFAVISDAIASAGRRMSRARMISAQENKQDFDAKTIDEGISDHKK